MSLLQEIKEMLSTWRATAVLLLLLAAAMAAATFLEAGLGTEAARGVVYHAWWFFVLYGLLIANFVLVSHRYGLWRRKQWGLLLLHYGFAVILGGAAITHLWGYEGMMHIRTGQSSDRLFAADGSVHELPFRVTLRDFRLVRYPGSNTPSSYESDVTIHEGNSSRNVRIYMNNIARSGGFCLYQSSYDPDERGTVLSVNHDPAGNAVTYAGYLLLCAGLVGSLTQKGSRFRTLLEKLDRSSQTTDAHEAETL